MKKKDNYMYNYMYMYIHIWQSFMSWCPRLILGTELVLPWKAVRSHVALFFLVYYFLTFIFQLISSLTFGGSVTRTIMLNELLTKGGRKY